MSARRIIMPGGLPLVGGGEDDNLAVAEADIKERVMPRVRFTQNIQRHVACPMLEVEGGTVRGVLESYFAANPPARGYVLDDQGALRKHMAIFINGEPVLDRRELADAVPEGGVLDVVQALSGG